MHPHNPIRNDILAKVEIHHNQQFGDKALVTRALKLMEEAGEVAGAVIRHDELRKGRNWEDEIKSEIGDVMIVLMGVCAKQGYSLTDITAEAVDKFLARKWDIENKAP